MRRNDKKKKKYFIIIFFIALITFLICFLLFFSPHSKTSDFYQSVIDYQDGYPLAPKENTAYSNSSGEALFFQAMASYEAEDYDSAISLFQNALKIKSDDPALRCFLLYYLNQSLFYRDGIGNRETISAAVDSISLYQPLVDRTDMLFNLFDTICFTKEDARFAVDLLYSYIQKTKNCTLDTKIFLKNYMGMTEYSHQEYSKSLRLFYDVELSLQNNATTPELMTELRFAKEYIANIYYLFEDYEKAAVLYEEVINLSLENNISFEYNSCINLANCFLENNHITKAKESIALLESNIDTIDPNLIPEIEANIYDVYANIFLKEGNLKKAESYLKKAEAYYDTDPEEIAFLGGKYFVFLTRCKLLMAKYQKDEVIPLLEDFLSQPEAVYYGLHQEAYLMLKDCYLTTDQKDRLIEIYNKLLLLDQDFKTTTQREYLEFSEYYQENSEISKDYAYLTSVTRVIFLCTIIILFILIFILILLNLLARKNITDQLTGIYNRQKLNRLSHKYRSSGTPEKFGVVMADIDYFKKYNDTYGHPAGDEVLKQVAKIISSSVRKKDIIIRYGGEEFLLLIPGVEYFTAKEICQRISSNLRLSAIPHASSDVSDIVTLSIGLCYQETASCSFEDLISKADQCLYSSKKNGRNMITSVLAEEKK